MPLQIIRNDIIKVKADAIVNTANPDPVIGAGTDSAIYKAAGKQKLLAARNLIGQIAPGQAIETAAYNLDAKFIIHTVCIPWTEGTEALDILADCYLNSLKLAEELNCRSVAFPLIGTGAYKIPRCDALGVATDVIRGFLKNSSMKVTLVLFDKESVDAASENTSKKIRSYIDEVYVEDAVAGEYEIRRDMSTSRLHWSGLNLKGSDKSFSEMVFEYADKRGIKDSELYGGKHELYFPRQTLSMIRTDKEYHPKKYICVIICLVLKLDLNETQDLLMRAGYSLSVSRKADVAVRYCIENRIFDVYKVDSILLENGCDGIKKLK